MSLDTTGAAQRAQIDAVRRLGPAGRFARAAEMSEDARRISIASELRRHPAWTEAEARAALFCRLWGPDLAARVTAFATNRR